MKVSDLHTRGIRSHTPAPSIREADDAYIDRNAMPTNILQGGDDRVCAALLRYVSGLH